MALSAVATALIKLGDVPLKKALELYGVGDRIEPMTRELNLIKGFLKDADSKCNKNPLVKQWVDQLRDLAYRIEDALDTFLVEFGGNQPRSFTVISNILRCGKNPVKVNILCAEINNITECVKSLYDRGTQLGIKDIKEENHPIPIQFKPAKPSDIVDSEVVGLDSETDHIISRLLDTNIRRRMVLSIVGTGGLGKTTLAHKVYKRVESKGEFDCLTWLSISQQWDRTYLWRQILYSIKPKMKHKSPPVTDDDLPMVLENSLTGKRYFIILDDVWTIDLWVQLETALSDLSNGSRVLITTRNVDIAMAADCNTEPFKPNYLRDDESLALLFRKALQQQIQPDNYPPDLKIIARRLIKKCGGLPLALAVLGGVLSRKARNSAACERVETTMDWHNPEGKNCSQILALSYEDLPYELKLCFLYFASFPEDYRISASHMTKMWLAEGFIPNDGAGTLEERAKHYLEKLVQRSLVLVDKKTLSGRSKTCKMHDLLRDLAIHEAKNNNFLTVLTEAENHRQVDTIITRRAALQFCTSIKYDILSPKTRSLICFGNQVLNYQGFRLLRVLNLERINDRNYKENARARKQAIHKGWLECLIHLRFLGFRNCDNYFGLHSVSFRNFKNFETLDLTGSKGQFYLEGNSMSDYPNDSLWAVPTLRHVISSEFFIPGPPQWDHLQNIQTIKTMKIIKVPVLVEKIYLRKLGVAIAIDPDEWKRRVTSFKPSWHVKRGSNLNNPPLLESMVRDSNAWDILNGLLKWTDFLTSLKVILLYGNFRFGTNVTRNLPCHKKIQKLELFGKWAIPLSVEILPINLVKFLLSCSKLEEDPMPVLERLKSLRILELGEESYTGTKLICSAKGFPSLEKLALSKLLELREWEIKEGAMPILNYLTINYCVKLHELPELRNVPNLRELVVSSPNIELYERMQSEDQCKVAHIPSVKIEKPR